MSNQPKEETMDSFAKAERRRQADVRVQEAQERAAKATAKFRAAEERADKWECRAEVAETELRKARAERERLDWPAEPTTRPRVHAQAGYEVGDLGPLVVSFQRRAGGRDYTYAAVGILPRGIVTDPRLWYVTGNRDHQGKGMAWETLMEWIGEHGRRTLVTDKLHMPLASGFTFKTLEKKVDAQTLLLMERDEMIDTVIASHSSTGSRRTAVLIPVTDDADAYAYLVAKNARNEGIYLVWSGADSNTDLTEEVYEAITEEAEVAGLADVYHVYSRRNLIVTDDVVWYQIRATSLQRVALV